jgi:hypoxanthine phosphoribosyltransferase
MLENNIFTKNSQVLVTTGQIANCVRKIAAQIEAAYKDSQNVLAIVLMTGAKWFADDLFREIQSGKFEIEYVKIDSYHGQTKSSGQVKFQNQIRSQVAGRDVLVIDELYDTGRTLKNVTEKITQQGGRVKTCVLLEKDIEHFENVDIDFLGLKVPDCFLIGYGLDYQGQFRELPFIATLNREQL